MKAWLSNKILYLFLQVPLIFASAGILATTFTICVFIKYVFISIFIYIFANTIWVSCQLFTRPFSVAICLFFFFRFNHTPVIMASGRELCYVLLAGVCLCYVMTFIILARPTVIRCTLLRIGLGLGLSLCYSAIFVKTNRISRIFNCGVKAVSRPIYTSPISQIAICLCTYFIGGIWWIGYILGRFSLLFLLYSNKCPNGLCMWVTDFFFFFFWRLYLLNQVLYRFSWLERLDG